MLVDPTALAKLVAARFDPEHLNPQALVVVPDIDEVFVLDGWDEEAQAWRLSSPNRTLLSAEVADAYMVRRVAFALAGKAATYEWEAGPQWQELVAEIADVYREAFS